MNQLSGLANKEGIPLEILERELKTNRAVILYHQEKPMTILNRFCSTKINTNMGISNIGSIEEEMDKLRIAECHGTDTVMDLSTKDTEETLRTFIKHSKVPVGSVPIYNCLGSENEDDFLREIETHVKSKASFITVHAAITRTGIEHSKNRITKIVSRGGGIIANYCERTGKENPLFSNFDKVLEIMKDSGCAISLGDALRPGSIIDAHDEAQLSELRTQGELVKRCIAAKVPVFCEGPGHVPLNQIEFDVQLQKRICSNVPYYVLGPLVTDTALGYDHISAAIGAAIAAAAGVEFLCALTPSEHYSLPTPKDIQEGVIAFRIAAHSADIVKRGAIEKDLAISKARYRLGWKEQEKNSITRFRITDARKDLREGNPCSMCGSHCPMNLFGKEKEKEK